jgi:hypothetical protein
MSWAAARTTTRVEDMAYCLLGLFGVNMPLLYGERQKAFFRLQEEIIKHSDDQSIFMWHNSPNGDQNIYEIGLLANNVSDFGSSGRICTTKDGPDRPYSITNIGLRIEVKLRQLAPDIGDSFCVHHAVELTGIYMEHENEDHVREENALQRPSLNLFLLQCLHEDRQKWYRSRVNDLLSAEL